ncbi:LysR family transcriptional regulator [Azospirillum sp. sgz301742]
MHLRQIEIFQAVMRTGTLRDAARLLGVSVPAVGKMLRHTEDQLRLRLFERVRGRLVPTEEARTLHGEVETLLARVATVRNTAGQLRNGMAGHLRIAATPALGLNILPRVLGAFARELPDLTVEVEVWTMAGLLPSLSSFRTDFGFAQTLPPPTPGILSRVLGEAELVALMPPGCPLAAHGRLHLADLEEWPLIGVRWEGPLGLVLARACETAGVALATRMTVDTFELARALVETGAGVAVTDLFTATAAERAGLVWRRFDPPVTYPVVAVVPEYRPVSAVAEAFIERFAAAVAAHV